MAGFDNDTVFAQEGCRIGDKTISTSEQSSVQFEESGDNVAFLISNTSSDANSNAYEEIKLPTTNSGNLYHRWRVGDTVSYAMGFTADSATPNFRLRLNNDGAASPSVGSLVPWRIQDINFGTNSSAMIVQNELTVANEGLDRALLQVNTNGTAGVDAVILLNQTNGNDDTRIQWSGGNSSNFDLGTYATDNSNFYLTQASLIHWPPSAANTLMKVTQDGEFTFPKTPAFLAYLASNDNNVTGNGTAYTLGTNVALTEVFDQSGDFNTNGTFTAPVDGRYMLTFQLALADIGATMTACTARIDTSNRGYFGLLGNTTNFRSLAVNTNRAQLSFTVLADMDASDTAQFIVTVSGGAGDTADLTGSVDANNMVCGYLAC